VDGASTPGRPAASISTHPSTSSVALPMPDKPCWWPGRAVSPNLC